MKQIVFTKPNTAELIDIPDETLGERQVLVKTEYTAVSAGTERANLVGDKNVSVLQKDMPASFPRECGYCGVGTVVALGKGVTKLEIGDRVIICFGKHKEYNIMPETAVKIDKSLDALDVVFTVITAFPMLAVRRTRLEIGEPALIVGLGILGLLGVELCKAAGACPVIAADFDESRRALAKKLGADYALDPAEPDYLEKVKAITDGKGAPVVLEVTGNGEALKRSLECTADMGRIALLGCTRAPVDGFDFYHDVHGRGISLIGTNNVARAKYESYPNCRTMHDDCADIVKLVKHKRIDQRALIGKICSPEDAPKIYSVLANDPKSFPIGVVFDWNKLK